MTGPLAPVTLKNKNRKLWLGRALIAVVLFLNLQAAVLFLIHPADYASGFELTGVPGSSMIQGMGLLFIMWNVPYLVALLHPVKHRLSLIEALIMQSIGVIGESSLKCLLPAGHLILSASVNRFILFDAADLVLLLLAWIITRSLPAQE
jgi:hypothetical protein